MTLDNPQLVELESETLKQIEGGIIVLCPHYDQQLCKGYPTVGRWQTTRTTTSRVTGGYRR